MFIPKLFICSIAFDSKSGKFFNIISSFLLSEGFGDLRSLKDLSLKKCSKLHALPDLSARIDLNLSHVPTWLFEWELGGRKAYDMMRDGFPSQPTELDLSEYQGVALPEGEF